MSAELPLINVEAYFNDPSVPDGKDIGFVTPQGIVYRDGVAIGRDDRHPNHHPVSEVLRKIKDLADEVDAGSVALRPPAAANPMSPEDQYHYEAMRNRPGSLVSLELKREIVSLFEAKGVKFRVAKCNRGDLWFLNGDSWVRMFPANIPPLPQE